MLDARSGARDFFISYRSADGAWAEWIAWELEAAGYTVFVQAWDFRPGQNFVHQMQQGASACARTVAVLTPAYFESGFTRAEWYSAFAEDPTGKAGLLLPVRVRECDVDGLLGQIIYIDLMGLDETQARERLLAGDRGDARQTYAGSYVSRPCRACEAIETRLSHHTTIGRKQLSGHGDGGGYFRSTSESTGRRPDGPGNNRHSERACGRGEQGARRGRIPYAQGSAATKIRRRE
jgi:hypothetical protein